MHTAEPTLYGVNLCSLSAHLHTPRFHRPCSRFSRGYLFPVCLVIRLYPFYRAGSSFALCYLSFGLTFLLVVGLGFP